MRRLSVAVGALSIALTHCTGEISLRIGVNADGGGAVPGNTGGGSGTGAAGNGGSGTGSTPGGTGSTPGTGGGGTPGTGGSAISTGGYPPYPDAMDPNDHPPQIGEPGCGFEKAAFCDTFGSPSKVGGRSRELDSIFWSASRMWGAADPSHAQALGMARLPQCRPDLPDQVWTQQDTLICSPTVGITSGHLLAAVSAQYYGQHGYRIRQPFDFAGRTGKIVFDATAYPLSPLWGWVSLAITEDPMTMPGYAILGNDEGSIIPRNAIEVHFANAQGEGTLKVRNVHVFRDFEDTLYPTTEPSVTYQRGKLNHFEVLVSQNGIEVKASDFSPDGITFGPTKTLYTVNTQLPFTRGYVHLSVHNHATLKYTPGSGIPEKENATIAQLDNVGFDGEVISNWREYEIPDALKKIEGSNFQSEQDPYNTGNVGYEIGYPVGTQEEDGGPKQTLTFKGVDLANADSATIVTSFWAEFRNDQNFAGYTLRARLNGKNWIARQLTPKESAILITKPVLKDPQGNVIGGTGTQGRFSLDIPVPVSDLVQGDNTLEFTTLNVKRSVPPLVCNTDLILRTR